MDSNFLSRTGRNYRHCQRNKQEVTTIVDDSKSSNPHSLLAWIKRQLHAFLPVNDPDYNPSPLTVA